MPVFNIGIVIQEIDPNAIHDGVKTDHYKFINVSQDKIIRILELISETVDA